MGSRPRLWLVDDDPEMAYIVKLLCRRGGQELAHFDAVAPTWEAWRRGDMRPDLVLLDVNLPVESGLELLRRRGGGGPPVALFCQPGLYRDIAAGWAEGADFLLAKDLVADPAAWAGRLGEILARAVGGTAAPPLEWMEEGRLVPHLSWGRTLSQEIEHPTLRALGGAVLTQVVRRCLAAGFGPVTADCLHPVSGRVSALALARPASVGQARLVFASLVDQAFRLVSGAAAVGCEGRLRDAWLGRQPTSGNGASPTRIPHNRE